MSDEELLTAVVIWLVLATIPAWIASTQGRNPVTWFGLSVVLSPVLAFVAVILTAPRRERG